jgi:two-component sensor histidine kinase
VQNIGFALHELATNAYKHGALSSPQGHVLVSWRGPQPDGRVYLEWVERNGPVVQAPLRQGFGSLVITELVAQALQGTAKLDFNPDGIHWRLDIPGSFVLTEPALGTAATT